MDPLSMAFGGIGAVANIFSANKTAEANEYIANLNYANEQQREADEVQQAQNQEQFRDKQYGDTQLGTTDARGNHTYFKQGVGWVTDETPTQQAYDKSQMSLDNAQTQEQMQKLLVDAPRQRAQEVDVMKNNSRANALADMYSRLMSNHQDQNATQQGDIEGLAGALAAKAKNADAGAEAATQFIRGQTNGATYQGATSELGRDDLANIAAAFAQGGITGRQDALKENSANDADYTNMFNTYAGQAKTPIGGSQVGAVGTNLNGVQDLSNAQSQGASQMNTDANQLGSALEEAFQKAPVPSMDYEGTNNSVGNAFASLAGLMGSQGGITGSQKYSAAPVTYSSVSSPAAPVTTTPAGFVYSTPLGYGGIGSM